MNNLHKWETSNLRIWVMLYWLLLMLTKGGQLYIYPEGICIMTLGKLFNLSVLQMPLLLTRIIISYNSVCYRRYSINSSDGCCYHYNSDYIWTPSKFGFFFMPGSSFVTCVFCPVISIRRMVGKRDGLSPWIHWLSYWVCFCWLS